MREKGQATIVTVLIIGIVSVIGAVSLGSLTTTSVEVEVIGISSEQALLAAWSGVDEMMYRLRSRQDFGVGVYQIDMDLGNGATSSATIQGDDSSRTVRVSGFFEGKRRNLEVIVASSSGKASFLFAVQSGLGGFELENNSTIVGKDGEPGNVYSNGDILGESSSPGNSGSKILGDAWAVGAVDELGNNGGVYIQGNAWASELRECQVDGDASAPVPPLSCSYGGDFNLVASGPDLVEVSAVDADFWKQEAANAGIWVGDCTINGGPLDCTGGTNVLGGVKIEGDLTIPSNSTTTFDGPVWVEGDMTVQQNNTFIVDDSLGTDSVVIVVSDGSDPLNKGRVVTASNVEFVRNAEGGGVIVISENTGKDCSASPAVDVTSNTATVVFVALDGCINIGSNSFLAGVLGYTVHVSNNSTIEYDSSLAQAILGQDLGGWEVVSVQEY